MKLEQDVRAVRIILFIEILAALGFLRMSDDTHGFAGGAGALQHAPFHRNAPRPANPKINRRGKMQ